MASVASDHQTGQRRSASMSAPSWALERATVWPCYWRAENYFGPITPTSMSITRTLTRSPEPPEPTTLAAPPTAGSISTFPASYPLAPSPLAAALCGSRASRGDDLRHDSEQTDLVERHELARRRRNGGLIK